MVNESTLLIVGHQVRRTGSSSLKDPEFLMDFRQWCLEAKFGLRGAACGLSSNWLVLRYLGDVLGM